MIYIRIEIWPWGRKADAELISEVVVENVGGPEDAAKYAVRASKPGGFRAEPYKLNSMTQTGRHKQRVLDPLPDSVLTEVRVNHKRSKGIWVLVRKVLSKLVRELED